MVKFSLTYLGFLFVLFLFFKTKFIFFSWILSYGVTKFLLRYLSAKLSERLCAFSTIACDRAYRG